MLSTRSARLAALLLLTLLFGWTVRSRRTGTTSSLPSAHPAVKAPVEEGPKTSFPDE